MAENSEKRTRLSSSGLLRDGKRIDTLVLDGESILHPSELLPELSEEERTFFYLVQDDDVEAVAQFLKDRPRFQVNCLNHYGTTALQEATQRSNGEMITLLLAQPTIQLHDCVLHAVASGDLEITEQLLDRWKLIESNQEYNGYLNSPSYTTDTTPLILAALNDDYCMIQMLLSRGHVIQPPHPPTCFCKEVCFKKLNGEDLAKSLKRLNAYRALASPAYISQTSDDPIYTCFNMAEELNACAKAEAEFRTVYLELADQTSNFAIQLLDFCRTTSEVETVVRRTHGNDSNPEQFPYPRILMAVDLDQKKFVAHPKIQQVFTRVWLGQRQSWKHYSSIRQLITFLLHLMLFPLIGLLSLLIPCGVDKYWSAPISKHINWVCSYLIFLMMIVVSAVVDRTGHVRGPPMSATETYIVVWMLGFSYAHWRQCLQKGFSRFCRNGWHWFDTLLITAFYLAFICRTVATYNVSRYDNVHLERKYWYQYDPTLIEESFTAIANILAFTRLLYHFQMSSSLGPLEISLGRMLQNVAQFLMVFAAVVISFALGMNRLFDYYKGMIQKLGNGDESVQMHSFVNLRSAFRTLFWTLFGLYDLEVVSVVIENLPGGSDEHPIINQHSFTEAIGYILYGSYHVLCVMIIMNMLIAMMTCTYHNVSQSADCEWKFARAKVWINYILEPDMAPPFNLAPSVAGVWRTFGWLGRRLRHSKTSKHQQNPEQEEQHAELMALLLQRYFRWRSEQQQLSEPATASALAALTNQARNTRAELRETARRTVDQRIVHASQVSLYSL